jgi:hypothetical protein
LMKIKLEGETVTSDYDIYASAGSIFRADIQEFEVTVTDGSLAIAIRQNTSGTILSGLEVLPVGGVVEPNPDPSPDPEPTPTPGLDPPGQPTIILH